MNRTRRTVVTAATTALLVAGGTAAVAYGPQPAASTGAGQSASAPGDPAADPVIEQAAAVHETLLRLSDAAGALQADLDAAQQQERERQAREQAARAASLSAASQDAPGTRAPSAAPTHRWTEHEGSASGGSPSEHENGEGGDDD